MWMNQNGMKTIELNQLVNKLWISQIEIQRILEWEYGKLIRSLISSPAKLIRYFISDNATSWSDLKFFFVMSLVLIKCPEMSEN